jgi:hypothetical protein
MPEPVSLPKVTDLFLGVVELFAVLAPGVLAAILLRWIIEQHQPIPLPTHDAALAGLILILAFIFGHLLHGLGSFLDVLVYDPLFKPLDDSATAKGLRARGYFRSNDALYRQAKTIVGQTPTGLYQFARAWLQLHSAEATQAVNRLEADSKFFRNLSMLGLLTLAVWPWLPAAAAGYFPAAFFALLVCLWRYCDLRQKMVRSCYLFFVLLKS